jgi:hypothetical protein
MSNLKPTIDAYAALSDQIKELEKKKEALKKELNFLDEGTHEGDTHILTITLSTRDTLDMKAVRDKLSAQFIRAHTTSTPVNTFRTRKREAAEA